MTEIALLQRRAERERRARFEAEQLLECKALEVHLANEQLVGLANELRENFCRTEAILNTAAEGIITYQPGGSVELFNRSACLIFQKVSGDGINVRDLFEMDEIAESVLFPPENKDANEVANSATDDLRHLELSAKRGDGKTFHVEASVSRLDSEDEVLFVALVRDLTRRKMLESRLSQSQKMESVGQLAAGIAHEINTPIQFVGDNIQFLSDAFGDLFDLLHLYGELTDTVEQNSEHSDLIQKIKTQADVVDLGFLHEELPKAIEQSGDGIQRVAKIVRAMKEFAQPGSDQKTSLDINNLINNVLEVSASQWQNRMEVVCDFEENLPRISCMAGPMNQAILNIIANAFEAFSDYDAPGGSGSLKITTRTIEEAVQICFLDNGPGIAPEIKPKLFNPFFTTKEVGDGMGQGLAFVYDLIVGKHQGSIAVNSELGEGAEFVLTIPFVRT